MNIPPKKNKSKPIFRIHELRYLTQSQLYDKFFILTDSDTNATQPFISFKVFSLRCSNL